MKRRVLPVLLLLAGGVVVSVAVAWACVIWTGLPQKEPAFAEDVEPGRALSLIRFDAPAVTFFEVIRFRDPGIVHDFVTEPSPAELAPGWVGIDAPSGEFRSAEAGIVQEARHVVASGWPLRTLWCESRGVLRRGRGVSSVLASQGGYIETGLEPLPGGFRRALPLRPVWKGFVVNSLLYAAVLGLLVCGPLRLRRLVRIKRGACPACGYAAGEGATCSECGASLPGRAS